VTHPDDSIRHENTAVYPIDPPTMILPQAAPPDADGENVWRLRLMLLGGLTAVIAVVVAVAVSVLSPGEGPAAGVPDAPASSAPGETPAARPEPTLADDPPVVTTRTVTTTSAVPFPTRTVRAKALPKGVTRVRVAGVAGARRDTYEVTYRDGVAVGRKLVRSVVVQQPVTRVVAVGVAKPKPRR
jgi:hypothetical protein